MLIINWTHCWNVPLGTRMMTGREKLQCTGHLYRCRRKEGRGGHQRVLGRSPSQPAVCVLLSLCWLMKWTLGLGNWFWLRLISPSPPLLAGFSSLCPLAPRHSCLPVSRFGSSHLFPLTEVEGWSQNVCVCVCVGGGNNTNKVGFLVLAVLFYPARRLSAQVKPLHHFAVLHSRCFIVPASQIICLLWESLQPSSLIFHETSSLS